MSINLVLGCLCSFFAITDLILIGFGYANGDTTLMMAGFLAGFLNVIGAAWNFTTHFDNKSKGGE